MPPLLDYNRRKRRLCESPTAQHGCDNDLQVLAAPRKRVRFSSAAPANALSAAQEEDDGLVSVQVHDSDIVHEDLDKRSLWWSKCERSTISEYTRKLARGFKRQESERIHHYLHVFDECSKKPSLSSSNYIETAKLGVPTEVRGLECGFVPSIKAHRKQHSQEVLSTQEHLQKGRLSEVIYMRVLSARAIRSSRRSRVMARLMGEADALEEVPELPPSEKSKRVEQFIFCDEERSN